MLEKEIVNEAEAERSNHEPIYVKIFKQINV